MTAKAKCTCALKYCTSCQSYKQKELSDIHAERGNAPQNATTPNKRRAEFLLKCGYTHITLFDDTRHCLQTIADKEDELPPGQIELGLSS